MIKFIKKKLSVKIFIITFILLGFSCGVTFLCISKLLPLTYSDLINGNIEEKSMQLVEQLESSGSITESKEFLEKFSNETNALLWVEDMNGKLIYPKETSTETEIFSGDKVLTYDEDSPEVAQAVLIGESTNYYPFSLKNGEAYTLAVQVDLYAVQQATEVLWSIFPYVVLMIILLSLFCSILYARHITRPIVKLSQTSKHMAALDFSDVCSEEREDELGCLAKNLNDMSSALSAAIDELQIANNQLKTDMEKKREMERQRVDFFAAASHELKTPLTILKGHLNGMLNKVMGYEDYDMYLKRSLAVVEKMEILEKELLFISRSDIGSDSIKYETVNLAEVFRVEIAGVTDLLSEKGQQIDVNIPNKILCKAERFQIERLIQNIMVNAIRYSPNGERIKVSLILVNDTIHCEVENSGTHIPDDAMPHLFEAFYRVDSSRSRATGGTGLGLYIVKNILESYQAKYGMANTQSGVLLWFDFPRK